MMLLRKILSVSRYGNPDQLNEVSQPRIRVERNPKGVMSGREASDTKFLARRSSPFSSCLTRFYRT